MPAIIVPKNPTSDDLTKAISQRFHLETARIKSLSWPSANSRDAAQNAVRAAYDGANALLAAIPNATANAPDALQPLTGPYQQAWLNLLGAIVKHGNSAESRHSLFDDAGTKLTASWQTIVTTVQDAPDAGDAVQAQLGQLEDATNFLNEIGTVAINIPIRSHLRNVMAAKYPGKVWSALSDGEQEAAMDAAVEEAGLSGAQTAIDYLGLTAVAISVGLAFLDSANDASSYAIDLSKSLTEIGLNYAGDTLASEAFAASDAADTLALWLGTTGELVAALIPVGFGVALGIAVGAVVDVLWNVIFGVDNIPSELLVSITVPITVPID